MIVSLEVPPDFYASRDDEMMKSRECPTELPTSQKISSIFCATPPGSPHFERPPRTPRSQTAFMWSDLMARCAVNRDANIMPDIYEEDEHGKHGVYRMKRVVVNAVNEVKAMRKPVLRRLRTWPPHVHQTESVVCRRINHPADTGCSSLQANHNTPDTSTPSTTDTVVNGACGLSRLMCCTNAVKITK